VSIFDQISFSLVLYFSLRRQRVIKYTHIRASLGRRNEINYLRGSVLSSAVAPNTVLAHAEKSAPNILRAQISVDV
jgi:hypothetical protein